MRVTPSARFMYGILMCTIPRAYARAADRSSVGYGQFPNERNCIVAFLQGVSTMRDCSDGMPEFGALLWIQYLMPIAVLHIMT